VSKSEGINEWSSEEDESEGKSDKKLEDGQH